MFSLSTHCCLVLIHLYVYGFQTQTSSVCTSPGPSVSRQMSPSTQRHPFVSPEPGNRIDFSTLLDDEKSEGGLFGIKLPSYPANETLSDVGSLQAPSMELADLEPAEIEQLLGGKGPDKGTVSRPVSHATASEESLGLLQSMAAVSSGSGSSVRPVDFEAVDVGHLSAGVEPPSSAVEGKGSPRSGGVEKELDMQSDRPEDLRFSPEGAENAVEVKGSSPDVEEGLTKDLMEKLLTKLANEESRTDIPGLDGKENGQGKHENSEVGKENEKEASRDGKSNKEEPEILYVERNDNPEEVAKKRSNGWLFYFFVIVNVSSQGACRVCEKIVW